MSPSPRPRHHRFDQATIARLLALVLVAGVALRAAARALALSGALAVPLPPHPSTGRLWLLRLGLFHLNRPLEPADDWCWLIDHSAPLGRQRLFVVLGLRLRAWAARARRGQGTLARTDVRVLHVQTMTDPDGPAVATCLQTLAARAGVPRAIVSDRGADVLKGIRLFRATRPQVAEVCDAKHFAANRLKGLLSADPAWAAFQADIGQTRAALQQTEWAFVVPPALRTKSRYLNLDVLLRWAAKARALLKLPKSQRAKRGDVERLEKALGWLRQRGRDLKRWEKALALTEEMVGVVRDGGVHRTAHQRLGKRLARWGLSGWCRELAERLVGFVREQGAQVKGRERLVGSTEVLESLFGRFKALTRDHSRGGVTGLALALPALLGRPEEAEVAEALAECSTADAREWVKKNLAPNVQSQRLWLSSLQPSRKRSSPDSNEAVA